MSRNAFRSARSPIKNFLRQLIDDRLIDGGSIDMFVDERRDDADAICKHIQSLAVGKRVMMVILVAMLHFQIYVRIVDKLLSISTDRTDEQM